MNYQQIVSQQQIEAGGGKLTYASPSPSNPTAPSSPAPVAKTTPSWLPWAAGAAVGGVVLFLILRD